MYDFDWTALRNHCHDQSELMQEGKLDSVGLESLREMLVKLLAIESGLPGYQRWCDRLGLTLLQIQEHRPLTDRELWRITAGKERGGADLDVLARFMLGRSYAA